MANTVQQTPSPVVAEMIDRYGITQETRNFLARTHQMVIGGRSCEASTGERLEVYEPSTGGLLTTIPAGNIADVDTAVSAAREAFCNGPWGNMPPAARQRVLLRLADLIEEHAQILGEIETLDNGKALQPCIDIDILGGADLIRFMAGFATKIEGATREVSAPGQHFAYTCKKPVGVVAAIVPWNFPFNMACWKIAAPLAAGCTIVLKPSELTSLSMLYFMDLCDKAGLPAGVLNILTGEGHVLGDHLVGHPDVDKVTFTGSTKIGRRVGEVAGHALTPVTLELGGKSPMIVFADADLDAVVEATRNSVFFNAGQVCSAGSRLYAHRSIVDVLTRQIAAMASNLRLRPGLDPECDVGPVISDDARNRIIQHISVGAENGKLECGGIPTDDDVLSAFVKPTVIRIDDNHASIVQEEIFGPVLVIVAFDDEAEVLNLANDNEYGLAASIWTKCIDRVFRLVPLIDAGSIWVNTHDIVDSAMPFGGTKSSGFGKDMGREQLDGYLTTKAVWIAAG